MRRQKEQKIHSKKRIWVVPVLLSAALLETIAVYADEEQTKAAESEASTDLQPGDKGYLRKQTKLQEPILSPLPSLTIWSC